MSATEANKMEFPARSPILVVGLGNTGLSVARFLLARNIPFSVADSRATPPGMAELQRLAPEVEVHTGPFDPALFSAAGQLIVSPGVSLQEPAIVAARRHNVAVLGDIELFARTANAPVVAITGSNGKSTVTTLLGEMARHAGLDARVGGNLGIPALDLLCEPAPDLYILELSSFQLETTRSLNARAATVLNLSPDHMDRHASLLEYAGIKHRVYRGDGVMVLNADDPLVAAMAESGRESLWFSLRKPAENGFGLCRVTGAEWLCHGKAPLLAVGELRIAGRHNVANALAALALGSAVGLPTAAMLEALREFPGLPHRCQWVAERDGVQWYNDSKGTNVGATVTALDGVPGEKVVLIAGGEGKGQDFTPLREVAQRRARAVVLIGRDAPLIEQALAGVVPVLQAQDMAAAVGAAAQAARPGDAVLLSPACASFDMFDNYIQRGERFVAAVQEAGR